MFVTWYIAHLKCNHCGTISPKNDTTQLSNKVRQDGSGDPVEKVSVMDIELDDISSDFIRIKEPDTNKIRCTELWSCPTCRQQNFAELVYLLRPNDVVMEEIKSVVLTAEYLDTLHYLSENIDDWAGHFTETPVFSSMEPPTEEIQKFRDFLVKHHEVK